MPHRFHVVQPYGRDVGRESTVLSTHRTAPEAFASIDATMILALWKGTPLAAVDALELIVLDSRDGCVLTRRPN